MRLKWSVLAPGHWVAAFDDSRDMHIMHWPMGRTYVVRVGFRNIGSASSIQQARFLASLWATNERYKLKRRKWKS